MTSSVLGVFPIDFPFYIQSFMVHMRLIFIHFGCGCQLGNGFDPGFISREHDSIDCVANSVMILERDQNTILAAALFCEPYFTPK